MFPTCLKSLISWLAHVLFRFQEGTAAHDWHVSDVVLQIDLDGKNLFTRSGDRYVIYYFRVSQRFCIAVSKQVAEAGFHRHSSLPLRPRDIFMNEKGFVGRTSVVILLLGRPRDSSHVVGRRLW